MSSIPSSISAAPARAFDAQAVKDNLCNRANVSIDQKVTSAKLGLNAFAAVAIPAGQAHAANYLINQLAPLNPIINVNAVVNHGTQQVANCAQAAAPVVINKTVDTSGSCAKVTSNVAIKSSVSTADCVASLYLRIKEKC